jgi:AcrR family transcriptional regulator
MTEAADTRRPGRPRSPEAHAAILRAALELAVEGGLRGLSMEAIAARAGVGKATIYRRWKSKAALVAEAIGTIAVTPAVPDTGSVHGDFTATSSAAVDRMAPEAFRVLPRLMADAGDDPELLEALHEALVRPRRAVLSEILRRGIARGEVRADIDLDLVIDMLLGPLIARVLMSGGDPTALDGLPMRVFETLAAGIATRPGVG